MIFLKKPENYQPKFGVCAAFVLHDGEFVFLKTANHKKLAGLWGSPAGKMEKNENPLECMKRELKEETQLTPNENKIKFFKTVYIKYPEMDFDYHMFYIILKEKPIIVIDEKESAEYKWVNKNEALSLPLIPDEGECINLFFREIMEGRK